jgi:hypothetical protein
MDPKRVVRPQAGIAATVWIGVALTGHALAASILAALLLAVGFVLWMLYLEARADHRLSDRRVRNDRYAAQSWLVGAGVALGASLGLWLTNTAIYRGNQGLTLAVGLLAGFTLLVIVACSLVDWYLIVPRIAGEICLPPCRSTGDLRWKRVTRLWYINRGVAALTVSLAFLAVIPIILSGFVDANIIAVIVAIVSAAAVVYIRGIDTSVHNVLHPSFYVGDIVDYLMPGREIQAYVVDVALEGVKLKQTHNGTYTGRPFFPDKHSHKVDTADLKMLGKLDVSFRGCDDGHCCGVNWYCRENPRAD